ncbi:glycine cleavage system H protein, mitochondrial [Episyrphus balteatus]|uniref:glycine cleavage system H protein, mitochondrial n=1 Tax=Episyrphus balteatus TaxID=286459 RepID=UPI0024864C44|nr:glycine cleavage system H protein, mitochondrial [Episyrphus balteatus]
MSITAKVLQSAVRVACASRIRYSAANQQIRCLSLTSVRAAERLYTDKHEWVTVDKNVGTVGISNYAQEALGDVVYAQLPDPGTDLTLHQECGALESVKAASEVYSPVSGTVVEKNTEVEESPALINTNCYDKGWLFKVDLADAEELKKLMNENQYQEYLKTDAH